MFMEKMQTPVPFRDNGRLKLLIIVGTRPEIIRLSAVIRRCREYFDTILAHTGQNYDYNLNGIFFRDLGLKEPDVYLNAVGKDLGIDVDKQLNPNSLTVLKTDAPYVADKLYTLKTQKWNEALTYLGISNVNITKRERLITDEVTRNQGGTIASRYSRLESRRQACKQINEMFHLNIQCDYREDYQEIVDAEDSDSINVDERDEVNE